LIAVGFSLVGAIFVMPAVLSVMARFEKSEPQADGKASLILKEEGKMA